MKKLLRKILLFGVLLVLILGGTVLIRTALFTSKQITVSPAQNIVVHKNEAATRLAQALKFKTIANPDSAQTDSREFQGLLANMEQSFPRVHQSLKKEVVGEYSLLYTWKGRQESLKPMLLMAHMDVVPIEPGTEANWIQPPFDGKIVDNFIWGRGSMDDKVGVFGILEAVETLLEQGVEPQRTIYLAFGQDEEIGGQQGAVKIAALLKSRNVDCEFVLDEGLVITEGVLPGISAPIATIGVAEKGSLSLELTVNAAGGHSSMPPQQTAIGILSTAITRLEANQMPSRLDGPARAMLEQLGPEMSFSKRLALSNLWLFGPLVARQFGQSPTTNAFIRTTTAVTIFEAGNRENVLPIKARAVVNFRVLPGDSLSQIVEHTRQAINDQRVQMTPMGTSHEASFVSDTDSIGYTNLRKTVRQVFPTAIVAPALVVGGTDGRHYSAISRNIYRFLPVKVSPTDIPRYHGTNERIAVDDYETCVKFYAQLIRNSAL